MSHSTDLNESRYLVRNKLRADILLPYPSLDEHPKDILWSGHCMIADMGLVQSLEGWLEIIDVIPSPGKPGRSSAEVETCESEDSTDVVNALLQTCWELGQGRYLKVSRIAEAPSVGGRALLKGVDPESREARVVIGRLFRKLAGHNPPGWIVRSRERSHTVEYRIMPNNL